MNLNKKQVGALLKVMYKDTDREAIRCLSVSMYSGRMYAVATNGYILAALRLDPEEAHKITTLKLRRDTLEKWYKLADGKSRLTTAGLVDLFNEDYAENGSHLDVSYPNWQGLVPEGKGATGRIAFNAEYAKVLQDLDGDTLSYSLNGELGAMCAKSDRGIYLLMPKKT